MSDEIKFGTYCMVLIVVIAYIVALFSEPGWTVAVTFVAFIVAAILMSSGDGGGGMGE